MDRYDAFYGRERRNHQDLMLDLIVNYGFLAPAKMAYDERQRQLLQDAALSRLTRSVVGADGPSSLCASLRQRLGALFIRLGTALQGASTAAGQRPATNGAAVSP